MARAKAKTSTKSTKTEKKSLICTSCGEEKPEKEFYASYSKLN